MSEHTLVTVTEVIHDYTIMITQEYLEKYDMGHTKTVIIKDGHIMYTGFSSCGAPKGKISYKNCIEAYNSYMRYHSV